MATTMTIIMIMLGVKRLIMTRKLKYDSRHQKLVCAFDDDDDDDNDYDIDDEDVSWLLNCPF